MWLGLGQRGGNILGWDLLKTELGKPLDKLLPKFHLGIALKSVSLMGSLPDTVENILAEKRNFIEDRVITSTEFSFF